MPTLKFVRLVQRMDWLREIKILIVPTDLDSILILWQHGLAVLAFTTHFCIHVIFYLIWQRVLNSYDIVVDFRIQENYLQCPINRVLYLAYTRLKDVNINSASSWPRGGYVWQKTYLFDIQDQRIIRVEMAFESKSRNVDNPDLSHVGSWSR